MNVNKNVSKFEKLIEGIVEKGFAVCDEFLSPVEVEHLISRFSSQYEEGNFKIASIGKLSEMKESTLVRGDQILWLDGASVDQSESCMVKRNNEFINYLNQTCYLGIVESEFHFAKFEIGKFYRRHRDTFQDQKGRVLSVIYYLNESWEIGDGGELVIYIKEDGIEKAISIAPIAGRMVCFKSELLEHEVLETFKDRYSVTGWFLNKG